MGEIVCCITYIITGLVLIFGTDSEHWRYTGPFTRFNRFKGTLPGLGTATVAFTIYCAYEYLFMKDEHHGHSKHDHKEEH